MADLIGDGRAVDPMADHHDKSIAFRAHPKLPEPLAVRLEYLWRDARACGDFAKAAALERLAVRDNAAVAYWRELQDCERGRDNPRRGELEHPTVIVGLWRDRDGRRFLMEMLRKHPQRAVIKAALRSADKHEYKARENFFVILLDRLAELATTDERAKAERAEAEIAKLEHDLEKQRRAYLLLCESGLTDEAEQFKMNALRHLIALESARRAKAAGEVTALGGPGARAG
jgi:hypothetical protein